MEDSERIQLIYKAIEMIVEAKSLVDEAINGTNLESHYEAYGCYGLNTALGNGNPYDSSLETLIKELNDPDYRGR